MTPLGSIQSNLIFTRVGGVLGACSSVVSDARRPPLLRCSVSPSSLFFSLPHLSPIILPCFDRLFATFQSSFFAVDGWPEWPLSNSAEASPKSELGSVKLRSTFSEIVDELHPVWKRRLECVRPLTLAGRPLGDGLAVPKPLRHSIRESVRKYELHNKLPRLYTLLIRLAPKQLAVLPRPLLDDGAPRREPVPHSDALLLFSEASRLVRRLG